MKRVAGGYPCLCWLALVVHGSSSIVAPIVAGVGELSAWRYCPRCGANIHGDAARRECNACGFVAYANSKPTASALVTDERGRVLLARRRGEPFANRWDLPGGFLEEGEHPLDALRRELREETRLAIEPEDFLGIWMDRYGSGDEARATLNLYWTARIIGGAPDPADDVTELAWFAPGELPAAEETAFHIADVLSAWQEHTQRLRVEPQCARPRPPAG